MHDQRNNIFGLTTRTSAEVVDTPAKKQLLDLRKILLEERGQDVVKKLLDIALNDEHSGQMAALKLAVDRLLPVTEFDKEKAAGGIKTVIIDRSCNGKVIIKTGNGTIEMADDDYSESLIIEGENNG